LRNLQTNENELCPKYNISKFQVSGYADRLLFLNVEFCNVSAISNGDVKDKIVVEILYRYPYFFANDGDTINYDSLRMSAEIPKQW
jgi:hypothetical protein